MPEVTAVGINIQGDQPSLKMWVPSQLMALASWYLLLMGR